MPIFSRKIAILVICPYRAALFWSIRCILFKMYEANLIVFVLPAASTPSMESWEGQILWDTDYLSTCFGINGNLKILDLIKTKQKTARLTRP